MELCFWLIWKFLSQWCTRVTSLFYFLMNYKSIKLGKSRIYYRQTSTDLIIINNFANMIIQYLVWVDRHSNISWLYFRCLLVDAHWQSPVTRKLFTDWYMIIFAVFVLHIIIRFLIHTHTPTNNYINFSQSSSQISDHHEYHLQPGNEFRIAFILSAIFIIPWILSMMMIVCSSVGIPGPNTALVQKLQPLRVRDDSSWLALQ